MMVGAELFEPGRFDLNYSDYKAQVEDNPDSQNRELSAGAPDPPGDQH